MHIRKEIYDTYWHFAAERQNIFFNRLKNREPPFSNDPILQHYKFCNVYRAADRVSQFLIREVIYCPKIQNAESTRIFSKSLSDIDTAFRIVLFRLLNKNETWQRLESRLGPISLAHLKHKELEKTLKELSDSSEPIYGNAFILCATKAFGFDRKWQNHLALLRKMFFEDGAWFLNSASLEALFLALRSYPLLGNFMAYQLAIDLNYSELFDFNENDFTIAGPGAERGIRKCFIDPEKKDFTSMIMHMVENQEKEFTRLGLQFKTLGGRPLHAIDCQGLFCEVDKYCRIKYPHLKSNRIRMKSEFTENQEKISYFFPPKWNIDLSI